MKDYLVIFVSFHNNEIEHYRISAPSGAAAMKELLFSKGWEIGYIEPDEEFIKETCYNGDCLIEAIEI
jgi:hypothetical protein